MLEAFTSRKPLKDLSENHPARLYTSIWDRVSVMDAVTDQPLLVVDNQRIIVPTKLRQTIVDDLHSKTHRGAEQMKLTLRSLYFWPTQKAMVDKTCKDCIACLENKDSQPMEPFLEPGRGHHGAGPNGGHSRRLVLHQWQGSPVCRGPVLGLSVLETAGQ